MKQSRQMGLTVDTDLQARIRRFAGGRSLSEVMREIITAALDQAENTDQPTAEVQRAVAAFAAELRRLGEGKSWTDSENAHAAMKEAITRFIDRAFPAQAAFAAFHQESALGTALHETPNIFGDPLGGLDPTTLATVLVSTYMARHSAPEPPAPKVKPRRPRR
jgi:hypothetical protein